MDNKERSSREVLSEYFLKRHAKYFAIANRSGTMTDEAFSKRDKTKPLKFDGTVYYTIDQVMDSIFKTEERLVSPAIN